MHHQFNASRRFHRALRHAALAVAIASCLPLFSAQAQTAAHDAVVSYNIPAGDLAAALDRFSEQSGLQLLYRLDVVSGKRSNAVSGSLQPSAALSRMLEGTGVTFERANSTTFAIKPAAAAPTASPVPGDAAASPKVTELETLVVRGYAEILTNSSTQNIDIRRTEDDTQPYVVFDREEIEKSGATSVPDFFRKRLTAGGSGPAPGVNTSTLPGSATSFVMFRGLSTDEALILVDGRRRPQARHPSQTSGQADISGIPLAAIERIEVLPASASGIYGSNATGGVINLILRRDYSGFDVGVTYGNTSRHDSAERQVDLSGGFTLDGGRTTFTGSVSWSDGDPLLTRDRDFIARYNALNLANVPFTSPVSLYGAANPFLGATTNIRSTNPAVDLTLKPAYGGGSLGSPYTSVPYGYAGPASDAGAGLIASAGAYNFDLASIAGNGGGRSALRWVPERQNYMANLRRDMTDALTAFVDVNHSVTRSSELVGPEISSFTLTPADPGNPFNQTIRVTTPLFGADRHATSSNDITNVAGGIIWKLPREWRVATDLAWNRSKFESERPPTSLTPAAAAAIASGAIDIFRDTNQYAVDFGSYLNPSSVERYVTPVITKTVTGNMVLSGPLDFLPIMQSAVLTVALNQQRDDFSATKLLQNTRVYYPGQEQKNTSLYMELRWPIVAEGEGRPGLHALELQVAGRHDRYEVSSGTGTLSGGSLDENGDPLVPVVTTNIRNSSTNPSVSLSYQPVSDVLVRASYTTGFRPPVAFQLRTPTQIGPLDIGLAGLTDPLRGNEPITIVSLIAGGNPALDPETTASWSAGVVLKPRFIPGLRLSADWIKTEKHDGITAIEATTQLGIDQRVAIAPELLIRGAADGVFPVGPIIAIDQSLINVSGIELSAVDYALDYDLSTRLGEISLSAKATQNLSASRQLIATSPEIDTLDTLSIPKWRGYLSLGWERGAWAAGVTSRLFPSYYLSEDRSTNIVLDSARIGSQHYEDLYVRYRFPEHVQYLKNFSVRLAVNNVLDRKPLVAPSVGGSASQRYSQFGDPLGANYSLALRKSF